MLRANILLRLLTVTGCLALSAAVAHAGAGSGTGGSGFQAFQCYVLEGEQKTGRMVTLDDQFGERTNVRVGEAQLLCTPVTGTVTQGPDLGTFLQADQDAGAVDHLQCHSMSRTRPTAPLPVVKVVDQFGVEILKVHAPDLLCMPAVKKVPCTTDPSGWCAVP
jgi:hypothetical protein